jgi:hypothetical protein
LKVIRSLQQDLAERFREVRGHSTPDFEMTDDDQEELQSIANE